MLTPTAHQEEAIQRIFNEPSRAALNGSQLGTGKTLVATEAIKRLNQDVNLVTGPLHTLDGWERHFNLQNAGELRIAHNKNNTGRAALSDLKFGIPGNYFMGRELARLQDWRNGAPNVWVADESHSMVNGRSTGYKNHKPAVMPVDFRLHQSATWFGAKFENARTVAQLLWPQFDGYNQIADASLTRWRDAWCAKGVNDFWTNDRALMARVKSMNPNNILDTNKNRTGDEVAWLIRVEHVVGEKNPGRFASELPCYIRMESDLPELEPILIHYDLSPTQRKLYRQMEEQSLAWLKENPLVAELDIVQRIRLREITLAEPSIDANGQVTFAPDAKSALTDLVLEMEQDLIGEQILMGSHSAKFARYLAQRMGNRAYAWTRESSETSDAQAKADFLAGKIKHIVSTQAAIGEGTDRLQEVSHVLFELSLSTYPIHNEQFRGRLNRRGQEKKVVPYRFIARNTLEDAQHESALSKELMIRQSTSLMA